MNLNYCQVFYRSLRVFPSGQDTYARFFFYVVQAELEQYISIKYSKSNNITACPGSEAGMLINVTKITYMKS